MKPKQTMQALRGLAALLLFVGCASQREEQAPNTGSVSQPVTAQESERERGGEWSVYGSFRPIIGLAEVTASAPIIATLQTTKDRKVDVIIEGRGLDHRVVRRVLQAGLVLRVGVSTDVSILPADLPLQSVGGVAQVKIKAQYKGNSGETVTMQVGPDEMYVTHSAGYSQAWATTDNMLALGIASQRARLQQAVVPADVLAKATSYSSNPSSDLPLGRQLLTLPQNETGRYRDANGNWVDYLTGQSGGDYERGGTLRWGADLYTSARNVTSIDPGTYAPITSKTIKFCTTIRPDFRDNGAEKYLRDEDIPAGLTTATIRGKNNSTTLFSGQLDALGCANVTINNDAPCFGVDLNSELIGTGNTRFLVGPRTTFNTAICFKPNKIVGLPSGYTVSMGSTFDEPVVRGMAVAQRIATMPDPGFLSAPGIHTIETKAGCSLFPILPTPPAGQPQFGEACYTSGDDTAAFGVALNPNTSQPLSFHTTVDKFVLGHEIGHMQQNWSTGSTAVRYPGQDGITTQAGCKCDKVVSANQFHCLNSREYLSTAQSEGWGHFFSSKVMNDLTAPTTSSFTYYKELWTDAVDGAGTHVVKVPPFETAVNPTTSVKWRNNHCGDVEFGSEWDWLTFLTNVHTQAPNALPIADLADIWQRACGASGTKCGASQELTWATTGNGVDSGVVRRNRGNDAGLLVAGNPVNNAARNKYGIADPRFATWQSKGNANGVSNDLTP
jgi:hypothetical protein